MKEVIKMATLLNYGERQIIFWCYTKLKQPFYDILNSCEESNLNDNIRIELQTKAKTAINKMCDEVIELLDDYWIKRDDSNEAVAEYKAFLAAQY